MTDKLRFAGRERATAWLAAATVLVGLTVAGCLKRKERIEVQSNGDVRIQLEYVGDPGDFDTGDAMPSERGGWSVKDEDTRSDDGKEERTRKASIRVQRGKSLPETFAEEGQPAEATALRFPTEVTIEKRSDGTYYHFKRTYEAREHARYQIHMKQLQGSGQDPLEGKDLSELTQEDRQQLVEKLRAAEAFKRAEFLETACDAMKEWPQDRRLLLRAALLDHYKAFDVADVVELLGQPASPERDASINRMGERMSSGAREALDRRLEEMKAPRREVEEFFAAMDEEEARRTATEDLNDEVFEISVKLPGEILGHNGVGTDDGEVKWEFSGEVLMDRDHILMATSRVDR